MTELAQSPQNEAAKKQLAENRKRSDKARVRMPVSGIATTSAIR